MQTVISASRRTDIPAFYLDWFMNAIRYGSIEVENPFYPTQKRQINLKPDQVGWIVFWSRNYAHFLKKHDFFSAYNLFFHFTILPQSKLEQVAIPLKSTLKQMERLCALYGPERIIWRYDPLVFWQEKDLPQSNHDLEKFAGLCRDMQSFGIQCCYFSFAHPYSKFQRRFQSAFPEDILIQPEITYQLQIVSEMQETAKSNGITLYSCCNDQLLRIPSIEKGHCINGNLLNQLDPKQKVSIAKSPTRTDCGCSKSIDIGSYRLQPCSFGCMYCYANPTIQR